MDKKIVFVDESESFIIRSIIKSLEEVGNSCISIDWTIKDIEANKNQFSDLVIAYIDDASEIDSQALIYLRDICVEENHGLYLVGYEEDIEGIKSNYSLTNIAGEFYRPINAKEIAAQIASLIQDNPFQNKSHILVVDDSGTMLNTIQEWLGEKYRVSVVNSALNAITFLGKSIPDLILLDYEMPGCSGAQLLEMLRADTRTDSIPVIFLTGRDDPESVKRVLSLKPSGYLLKNMPKEYIIKQVDDFFELKKGI